MTEWDRLAVLLNDEMLSVLTENERRVMRLNWSPLRYGGKAALARELGISPQQLNQMQHHCLVKLQRKFVLSLKKNADQESMIAHLNAIDASDASDEAADIPEFFRTDDTFLHGLDARHRLVFACEFEGKTNHQVGVELGISSTRVQQMERKCWCHAIPNLWCEIERRTRRQALWHQARRRRAPWPARQARW
jgi:DNA-directed RNA polymerase sigma subunit (sigma70/sigma32)